MQMSAGDQPISNAGGVGGAGGGGNGGGAQTQHYQQNLELQIQVAEEVVAVTHPHLMTLAEETVDQE
jgi:hypothetical protein